MWGCDPLCMATVPAYTGSAVRCWYLLTMPYLLTIQLSFPELHDHMKSSVSHSTSRSPEGWLAGVCLEKLEIEARISSIPRLHKPCFLSYKHPSMPLDFHAVVSSRLGSAGVRAGMENVGLSFWVLPLGILLFVCLFVLSLSSIILCSKGIWGTWPKLLKC